jgi:L-aspartate oxidase
VTEPLDLLVLGSGVAGLSAVVRAADLGGMRVGVLTKGALHEATTGWAQGGIAAVLGDAPDSTDVHLADTLAAGAGLGDADAVRTLVDEGPGRVKDLIALGAVFDREVNGDLALAREGGHSHARVVHAGGAATGREVERALVAAVRDTAAEVYEHWFACELLVEHGRCAGVTAVAPGGTTLPVELRARHVLVATGGAGQLYAVTTNPLAATGDGIAMALRAGAAVADLEFVQFHPTALHHPSMPRPLLSEALRGHGALLRDAAGERFVDELLPRDQVSRAIDARIQAQRARGEIDHVWLDATGLDRFPERFPTLAAAVAAVGLDPARDWLPVAPAAHYTCGGVLADLDGASSLPGLWVAGEAACNGVHGANRLASNSLLDGMVFAPRVVEAIAEGKDRPDATGAMRAFRDGPSPVVLPPAPLPTEPAPGAGSPPMPGDPVHRTELQGVMTAHAGVLRSASSLAAACDAVARFAVAGGAGEPDREQRELANLVTVAEALCVAAAAREETRGAHARSDFPATSDALRSRLVLRR